MKRLTTHEHENYNQPGCNDCSAYRWECCKESGEISDCIQRLTWVRLLEIEDILGDDYDLNHLRKLIETDRMIGKEFRLEIDRVYGTVDAVLIEKDGLHFRIEDKGGGTYYVNEATVKIGTSNKKEEEKER